MKDCKFKLPVMAQDGFVGDSRGYAIADCFGTPFSPDTSVAHAAHIAKCVNLHEELVKACELALEVFDGVRPDRCQVSRAEFDALTAVLTKAKDTQ